MKKQISYETNNCLAYFLNLLVSKVYNIQNIKNNYNNGE